MVKGVHEGYAKTLDIVGTGYRAQLKGKIICENSDTGGAHFVISLPLDLRPEADARGASEKAAGTDTQGAKKTQEPAAAGKQTSAS